MEEQSGMIYTPKEHIPIGEAVYLPNGCHAIEIKGNRGKRKSREVITLDQLHELVVEKCSGSRAEIPIMEELAPIN